MGLRFRKSIKLCNGLRLNFGKTGASISFGGKGFRKTIHTSGKVTTSVGIPGTGVYWTESTNINKKEREKNNTNILETDSQIFDDETPSPFNPLSVDDELDLFSNSKENKDIEECLNDKQSYETVTTINLTDLMSQLKNIWKTSDVFIDWTEIECSESNDELLLDEDIYNFCKSRASKVLDGDIDTYLEVIEYINPLNDLIFAGEFEFASDDPRKMEIEVNLLVDNNDNIEDKYSLLKEYSLIVSLKAAKDMFSLLPVFEVFIRAIYDEDVLHEFTINREQISKRNIINDFL